MRRFALIGIVCTTAFGAALIGHGQAADLDPAYPAPPAYAEPDAQFEFGTGWYLRGDASFGPDDHPALDVSGFTTKKQDWNYVLGGGIGYKFNSFLRVDVTGDYFQPNNYSVVSPDDPTQSNTARIQKFDGLANLYIDLGTWSGLTPYVGAGAGFAVYDPSEKIAVANSALYGSDNAGSKTTFAWAAMAGVSYQVDPNIAVDLGYRHIDLGRFSTTLVGYAIDHHYTEDQVRIGLRYMIF